MRRHFLLLVLVWVCAFAAAGHGQAPALPLLGDLPEPEGGWQKWKLVFQHSTENKSTVLTPRWHFAVLENQEDKSLLSYAVKELSGDASPKPMFLADVAHEVFSDGYPSEARKGKNRGGTLYPLLHGVTSLGLFENASGERVRPTVLRYSFVHQEDKDARHNLMTQGYVLFGDYTVFVQHSAKHAITPELAYDNAHTILVRLTKTSKPEHLILHTKDEWRAGP